MAYDEDMADRIRELLGADAAVSERKMFGGLSFLVHGNLAVAASGRGGLLVRADPDQADALIAAGPAEPMEMGGRSMSGGLRIPPEHVRTERQLAKWVDMGTAYARSLEPKKPKRRSR